MNCSPIFTFFEEIFGEFFIKIWRTVSKQHATIQKLLAVSGASPEKYAHYIRVEFNDKWPSIDSFFALKPWEQLLSISAWENHFRATHQTLLCDFFFFHGINRSEEYKNTGQPNENHLEYRMLLNAKNKTIRCINTKFNFIIKRKSKKKNKRDELMIF